MPDIPVVVLGGGGVGKSCLTIQQIHSHFVDQYDATIEDVYRKTITIDNIPVVLTVVDTAGQEAFSVVRDQYLKKGQGFVLVYSITDAESFSYIRRVYSSLQRLRTGRLTPCVLVGNKVDEETYRAVSHEKGARLAAEIDAPFLEITAKDHTMCEQVFEKLVRIILSGGRSATPPSNGAAADGATKGADGASKTGNATLQLKNTARPRLPTSDGAANGNHKAEKKQEPRKCTVM